MSLLWPFAPLTSYVAGTTPAIKASDLNSLQAAINAIYDHTVGNSLLISDDFVGSAVSTQLWTTNGAGTVGVTDDSGSGAMGAISLNGTAQSAGLSTTHALAIGAADFIASTRLRYSTKANSVFSFGLDSNGAGGTNTDSLIFFADSIGHAPNWDTSVANGALTDTGVSTSAIYQWLMITRDAGVVTFWINGTAVRTVAFATSMTQFFSAHMSTTAAADWRVDKLALWVGR